MNAIEQLEERLRREMPGLSWECRLKTTKPRTGASLSWPASIEIHALQGGQEAAGSPVSLHETMLARWGVDSTARMICHEIHPAGFALGAHEQVEWDKLAEL